MPGNSILERWRAPGGYRAVLAVAGPLILSTGSWSIQHFVDRMYLTWYSSDTLAAALPAGMLSFTLVAFFLGVATYANTFVAQYTGAGRPERVGTALWQAIYFSLLAGAVIVAFIPLAGPIFRWAGHGPTLQALETKYFSILCLGGGFVVYSAALSTFYSGRGKTWTITWVTLVEVSVNIALDYAWIFGHWGFPAWGMAGAAWATVVAAATRALGFTLLVLGAENRRRFNTLGGWRFDAVVFRRLMRFGLPSGTQFFLDVSAFSLFVLLVGRIGAVELGATTLAFQINQLAFLPMLGFHIATSTFVGQSLGANDPDGATYATWSAFQMTLCYMAAIALAYLLLPGIFLDPFAAKADPAAFAALRPLAVILLRFVAVYCVFDTMNMVLSGALKGAGDTRFVMFMSVSLGWSVMVVPAWAAIRWLEGRTSLYACWTAISIYVILLGFGFLLRFRQGKWRSMRVIESAGPGTGAVASAIDAPPTVEVDL